MIIVSVSCVFIYLFLYVRLDIFHECRILLLEIFLVVEKSFLMFLRLKTVIIDLFVLFYMLLINFNAFSYMVSVILSTFDCFLMKFSVKRLWVFYFTFWCFFLVWHFLYFTFESVVAIF